MAICSATVVLPVKPHINFTHQAHIRRTVVNIILYSDGKLLSLLMLHSVHTAVQTEASWQIPNVMNVS